MATMSSWTGFFEEGFSRSPEMLILRGLGSEVSESRARDAWSRGVALVEVPVQSDDAWIAFARVRDVAGGRPVGVGTVTSIAQVEQARTEGAAFAVSPGFDPAITQACLAAGLPHLPGVATPTEVGAAMSHGYTWMKAFPASVLGPSWIRAVLGPFPAAKFVCTGGMSAENWHLFREAGASAFAASRAYDPLTRVADDS